MDNQPAAQAPAAQYPFTKREREILQALRHVKSMSLEAVARNLYMSRNTVLYHVDKLKRMTGHDPRTFEGLAACLKMMEEERYESRQILRAEIRAGYTAAPSWAACYCQVCDPQRRPSEP